MLVQCWASVADDVATLNQHYFRCEESQAFRKEYLHAQNISKIQKLSKYIYETDKHGYSA